MPENGTPNMRRGADEMTQMEIATARADNEVLAQHIEDGTLDQYDPTWMQNIPLDSIPLESLPMDVHVFLAPVEPVLV